MDEFKNSIIAYIKTEYGGLVVTGLSVSFAIEAFADVRNYPYSWTDEQKLVDMQKNKSKIAMAAVEIDSKNGAENQLNHSENGISRSYAENLIAYQNVIGFANAI